MYLFIEGYSNIVRQIEHNRSDEELLQRGWRGMAEHENRILVVDDEERIRRLLKMYLEKEGYEIDEAEDGETALRKATAGDYGLILLDVMLPGMDGVEVCTRLRQVKST